jgi:DNA mismatch endonuclease (patch repair protein)
MARQRSRDTDIETRLRRELWAAGLRYRLHRRPLPSLRREADVVFTRARVAVMVDGCYWHGCPEHGTWPKTNAEYWRAKIEGNQRRDRETDQALRDAGWLPLRVWEHEDPEEAARAIAQVVEARRRGGTSAAGP